MSEEVADLFITLRSITDPFSKGLKTAAADAESQSKRMGTALASVAKVGLGVGAAMVGIGVESVSMASKFNAQMTLLQTQAGVSKSQMAGLTSGVLSLAGQVGFSPTSLAQALFHVESSFASVGISGPKALDLLKIAAEGAAVGHADLVDVTNALDSAVVSGIPGVQDMSQAMGVLNATVGAGDMTMQDLANAFSTGLLATVKGYGLTFKDVGAGLAVFGDNNIRGAVAATDLRMAVQAMAVPAKSAGDELAKLGLSSTTLAKDMQSGGMLQALEDLKTHMVAAGVTTKEQGQVITELFGKKAGTGLNVLIDQLDRVKSKYPDLTKGATGFADAWTATKATFAQQMREIGAEADALGVRLGNFLLPHVSGFISAAQSDLGQAVSGFSGAATKPVAHQNLGNAMLNQEAATPPPLTGWQKFGQETHRVLTELEQDVVKLKPVGQDFVRFGEEAWQALQKLAVAAEPVAQVFGGALLVGITAAGKILADVVGPAFKDFADFLSSHQGEVKFFAEVVLGGLITKMTILSSIKAAQGVVGLATSIAQFPLQQTGQIKTAFDGLKTAWAGKEAAQGEKAVTGLKGAITDLKGAATGVMDKFPLFDSGKLAGLAKAGTDIKAVETAAADSEQLGLFETNLKGIVQVADTEQLALFETDIAGVGAQAETSAVSAEKLSGTFGKFALAGGMAAALVGVGLLADQLGKLMGVGDHTALSMDKLSTELNLAGAGSSTSRTQFTQTAVSMVAMSVAMGKMGMQTQGLKDVDTSLTQLVTSGHAQEAKAQFDDISAALAKQGISAQTAASKFPGYEQALKDAGTAADTMDGKVQSALDTLQKQQALDQFQSDLGNLSDQLKSTGNALTGNSQNAIANRQAFAGAAQEALDFYQQQRNANVPMAQATADLQKQYTALENVATAAIGSKSAADAFLATLGLIKPQYSTTLKVWVDTSQLAIAQGMVSNLGPGARHAVATFGDGGFVSGAKGAPQLILAHGGEYVVSNDMQAGSQHIDPRALGGMSGGNGRSVGGVMGGTTIVNNYYVTNVAGSVTTEKKLADVVRTQVLQYKGRNSTNGLGG